MLHCDCGLRGSDRRNHLKCPKRPLFHLCAPLPSAALIVAEPGLVKLSHSVVDPLLHPGSGPPQ
eukprot:730692-Hanusia_phi.AAC.5